MDLEKAYDMVWHHGLFKKMEKLNIKGRMMKFLKNFVRGRCIYVLYNGHISNEKRTSTGIPQRSILSPVLFNIFIKGVFFSKPL